MNDKKSDESEHAKKIANHLNIRNETLFIPQNFVKEIFYDLSEIFDEPFADSSQIPTLLLSRITKNKVSVILSGDGGDELFGGYNRYFSSENVWNKYSRFPSKLINFLPSKKNNYSSYFLEKTSIKINRLKQMAKLNSKDFKSFYINIIMSNFSSFNVLNENYFNSYLEFNLDHSPTKNEYSQQMMDIDFKNYLPDDILTKVDRASMAYSLETRSPFLNRFLKLSLVATLALFPTKASKTFSSAFNSALAFTSFLFFSFSIAIAISIKSLMICSTSLPT